MKISVEVLRCANHPQNYALAIAERRMTPFKCCGEWSTFIFWTLDSKELRYEIAQAFRDARAAARGLRA